MINNLFQLYKQAFSGIARYSWYLAIVMVVNRAGGMVLPFLSLYCVHQLHFTVVQAGSVIAMFGAGSICGSIFGGWLTDRIGFHYTQISTLFSGGALLVLLGYQHTFYTIGAGVFLMSFFNDAFRPANFTAIPYYCNPAGKAKAYTLNRISNNLGWALGVSIGGLLATINYHLLFWADGATNILAGIMLLWLMPGAPVRRKKKTSGTLRQKQSAYQDKVYLFFILLSTAYAMCLFEFMVITPVFYKVQWHFSEPLIGCLLSLTGVLIVVFEMPLVHSLQGKKNGLIFISGGILLAGMGFVLLNILPAAAITAAISITAIAFGEMMSAPFMSTFWVNRATEYNRGQYAGLYTMAWSAAAILGPLIGSLLITTGGFGALWLAMAGLCIFAATGYFLLYRMVVRC